MSTENEKPTNGDNQNEQPAPAASSNEAGERGDTAASAAAASAASAPAASQTQASGESNTPPAEASSPTPATPDAPREADDEDQPRGGSSDFDFGAMLDQYEQEQAAFQEGSVVKGTVIGINERGVVIDFGFKSEGVVPVEEF